MDHVRKNCLDGAVDEVTGRLRHWTERFQAELDFAQGLCRLHPTRKARWQKLANQAAELVAERFGNGSPSALARAVRQAEDLLAPIGKVAKRYTIHCVGHAHIDMNWQWSWPETVAVVNDTFTTVLKLMAEFDDFRFSQDQASVYAIIQQYNPELFEKIKRRIAEGRWEVTASQWVEGEKNLACGESLARHLLYTRQYCGEQFGLSPEDVPITWEPDTFGHAATVPTILSRGAVKRYFLWRAGHAERPPVFWWQGPDGGRVLVNRAIAVYNDNIGAHNAQALLSFCEETGLRDWMCVYGVGDHGGGPTRRDIRYAHEMREWPIYPNVVFATTNDYYSILEKNGKKLPVVTDEINFEWTGCYTTECLIKKGNRYGENRLQEAETANVLALRSVGHEYAGDMLRQAWIDVLFGQFHDILPGSGVRATRQYQMGLYQQAMAAAGMAKTHALRAIAAGVDTSFGGGSDNPRLPEVSARGCRSLGAGVGRGAHFGDVSCAGHVEGGARPFVVFNPTTWDRNEVVTATIWDAGTNEKGDDVQGKTFVARCADGRTVPAQQMDQGEYWGHQYVDLAFTVPVGALGYTALTVEQGEAPDHKAGVRYEPASFWYHMQHCDRLAIENEFLAVEIDRNTGGLIKLLEKKTGRDLADPDNPLAVLEYVLERPDVASAWVIHDAMRRMSPLEIVSIDWGVVGPYVASLVVRAKVNDSTIKVTYELKARQPWLEINVSANWLERGSAAIGVPSLRMQFPLALTDVKARYEIPFGSIERGLNRGEEVPALRWADVSGKVPGRAGLAGCTLLNDCKYGHSLKGSTLGMTLIRSSYEPDPLPDMGEHEFKLALAPHGQERAVAEMVRLGTSFNHPLQVVSTDVHSGALASQSRAAVKCQPDNVIVTNVKKAEDDNAVVFRLLETADRDSRATVTLDPTLVGKVAEAIEVDLLERPEKHSTAETVSKGFSVNLPASGIASVKVLFAE